MQFKLLGRTGVNVSELCFGTMSFGGDADEMESKRMYDACRERGISFFDCANVHSVSLAVAWVAAHPDVTCPIIGARSLEQLTPSLDSVNVEMTLQRRAEIAALSRTPPPATDRLEDQP